MTHKETEQEGVGWRHTLLERVKWWASWTRQWIFRFHHKRKISCIALWLLISLEDLWCVKLVISVYICVRKDRAHRSVVRQCRNIICAVTLAKYWVLLVDNLNKETTADKVAFLYFYAHFLTEQYERVYKLIVHLCLCKSLLISFPLIKIKAKDRQNSLAWPLVFWWR